MAWQIYFDESFGDDIAVMGGYLAPAHSWAELSAEWEKMLPFGTLDAGGNYHFKMNEMAMNPERMERARAFHQIIKRYVGMRVACWLRPSDFHQAVARIQAVKPNGRFLKLGDSNPYVALFILTLKAISGTKYDATFNKKFLSKYQRIDLIFDDRSEKKIILKGWDIIKANPSISWRYGTYPRFESDKEFLPLQAADFYAWWVRHWALEGISSKHLGKFPWGDSEGEIAGVKTHFKEEDIFRHYALE